MQGKQASVQSEIDSLEGEISGINEKAQNLLAEQEELDEQSKQLENEIADLQKRIDKREEAIREQARDVQVNGSDTNIVDAVLNSDSLTDAFGRVQAMNTIVDANNDLIEQQKEDKKKLLKIKKS